MRTAGPFVSSRLLLLPLVFLGGNTGISPRGMSSQRPAELSPPIEEGRDPSLLLWWSSRGGSIMAGVGVGKSSIRASYNRDHQIQGIDSRREA